MQNIPLISVVIPVYNQEQFISETLESVLGQTYKNLQVLVSDDCSVDNSLNIIKEYAAKDSRIQLLNNDKNLGICGNFNKLFDHVKGKYVVFFSGDDVMVADKIEKQYNAIKDRPEVMVVHHNAWLVDSNNRKTKKHLQGFIPLNNPLDWALKADWFHAKKIAPLLPTTCLARTEYYLHARYDNSFRYKHELLFTIEDYCNNPEGKWLYLHEPLMMYRVHESNFTNNPQFRQYLNEEKFKLASMAMERCPALANSIRRYLAYMLYETILFKSYDDKHREEDIRNMFKREVPLYKQFFLKVAVFLNKAGLYWPLSKVLNFFFYKPVYYLKYYRYNQ